MIVRNSPSKPNPTDTVARIAELLGCPVEAFTHGAQGPPDLAEMIELLELWQSISAPENRQRLLDMARQFAAL